MQAYRKKASYQLWLDIAKAGIEADGKIPENASAAIAVEVASGRASSYCDKCSDSTTEIFWHCIICDDNNYDICQVCKDKGEKCNGPHDLVKFIQKKPPPAEAQPSDEAAAQKAESGPEDESLFPLQDPMADFDVDNLECICRTMYLAATLGHNDIVTQIVQWDTDTGNETNCAPDLGTYKARLTPLAIAILMYNDEIVSTLMNSEPSMVVVEDRDIMAAANAESAKDEATEPTTSANGSAKQKASNEAEEDDDDDDDDDDIPEEIALKALALSSAFGTAPATKTLLSERGLDSLPEGVYLIHEAVRTGQAATIDVLLDWGAPIDEPFKTTRQTPLHLAAGIGTAETDTLIRRRANVDAQDAWERTPLWYAAKANNVDIVTLLLDGKASTELPDNEGNTPMHLVVETPEFYPMAKLLMGRGASLKVKNKEGKDPMDLALDSKEQNGDTYFMLAVSLHPFFFLRPASLSRSILAERVFRPSSANRIRKGEGLPMQT